MFWPAGVNCAPQFGRNLASTMPHQTVIRQSTVSLSPTHQFWNPGETLAAVSFNLDVKQGKLHNFDFSILI